MHQIKIGTCGFGMSRGKYAGLFDVVEVQQTFYQPPQIRTLEKWREEVPADFEFVVKAWQLITHEAKSPTYRRLRRNLTDEERDNAGGFKNTPIVEDAWLMTLDCARALRATRILFQCPASFKPEGENIERMRSFFTRVDRGAYRLLWEPRGAWDEALVRELCQELGLIHVVDPFSRKTVTERSIYWRLHGRGGYRYVYDDSELDDLAESLDGRSGYVMFNNTAMTADATRLKKRLQPIA